MERTKKLIGLAAMAFLSVLIATSIYYGAYQNLFFYLFIGYIIFSSLFLRPKRKERTAPQKREKEWSSFEIDEPKELPTSNELNMEEEISKAFKELYTGEKMEVEEVPTFSDGPSDRYNEEEKQKPLVKDWGTILFEKINKSARKVPKTKYDENEYEDVYSLKKEEPVVDPWELFKQSFKIRR